MQSFQAGTRKTEKRIPVVTIFLFAFISYSFKLKKTAQEMKNQMRKIFIITVISLSIFYCEKKEETGVLKIPPGSPAFFQTELPRPILSEHEHFTELYWQAWKILHDKIRHGTPANGFVAKYIDEGFNELIYQWDSCLQCMAVRDFRLCRPWIIFTKNNDRTDGYAGYTGRVMEILLIFQLKLSQ